MSDQPRSLHSVPNLPRPYLVFLGDDCEPMFAKTAFGLRDWAPEQCIGEYACAGASFSIGLPKLTPTEALEHGARSLVIGVANIGGAIRDSWVPALTEAIEAGLDIISGMHGRLADNPVLRKAAERHGRHLIDVRVPPSEIAVATGRKRPGKRLLTVGTDCALGKKYTALALTHAFLARGVDADFRATGQTGIMISGSGVPIDAVISDFVAGAAEMLSPDAPPSHWDIVEGQGSIFHPSYAGVSLGLMHGTQPDVLVLCHQEGRTRVMGLEGYALPSLREAIDLTMILARRTNPQVRCAGVSLNTSRIEASRVEDILARHADNLGMPVADPIRGGSAFDSLVDNCLEPE